MAHVLVRPDPYIPTGQGEDDEVSILSNDESWQAVTVVISVELHVSSMNKLLQRATAVR